MSWSVRGPQKKIHPNSFIEKIVGFATFAVVVVKVVDGQAIVVIIVCILAIHAC